MDNAQKAIMIGVGLFITIIIIAAVMLITGMGQDLINNSQNQVSNISTSLQAQLTADFDGSVVTGAKVEAAIKRYYTDEAMALVVVNNNTTNGTKNYGKIGVNNIDNPTSTNKNNAPESIGSLSNSGAPTTYVPSTAKYKADLLKVNDVVVGIKFVRQ